MLTSLPDFLKMEGLKCNKILRGNTTSSPDFSKKDGMKCSEISVKFYVTTRSFNQTKVVLRWIWPLSTDSSVYMTGIDWALSVGDHWYNIFVFVLLIVTHGIAVGPQLKQSVIYCKFAMLSSCSFECYSQTYKNPYQHRS